MTMISMNIVYISFLQIIKLLFFIGRIVKIHFFEKSLSRFMNCRKYFNGFMFQVRSLQIIRFLSVCYTYVICISISHPFPHSLTHSLTNFILRISCHRDQKTLNQSSSFLYASSILALPNFLCVNTLLVFLKLLSLMTIFICVFVIVMHSETIVYMDSIQRGCYINVSYCCCCY